MNSNSIFGYIVDFLFNLVSKIRFNKLRAILQFAVLALGILVTIAVIYLRYSARLG